MTRKGVDLGGILQPSSIVFEAVRDSSGAANPGPRQIADSERPVKSFLKQFETVPRAVLLNFRAKRVHSVVPGLVEPLFETPQEPPQAAVLGFGQVVEQEISVFDIG
jgi:hypothetical protein